MFKKIFKLNSLVINKKVIGHISTLLMIIIAILLSANIFFIISKKETHKHNNNEIKTNENEIIHWTCSMHPQIKLPQKGSCPICAMDLIPLYRNSSNDEDIMNPSLTLSEAAINLAEIETTEVVYKEVFNELQLIGNVDYDESRISYISAWVAGRIDRLFVDFTGINVRKGDHLIKIYSPELLSAQEEYLQAIKNIDDTKDDKFEGMNDADKATIESSKEKLLLKGITQEQILEIEKNGKPFQHMIIYSPLKGTIINKNGFEGMYVNTGDRIYTIADLTKVWVFLEAYETDISWLHYGQDVIIEAESYPGEKFSGKIAFIEPFIGEVTRTIKLRVNVDNKDLKLKPGMFVRAKIKAVLDENGKIYSEYLAGKFICPMHPDIIKNTKETCDICAMPLVKTSEFGFSEENYKPKKSLVIPKTAPIITGKRAIVYVENNTKKNTVKRYEGREVILGSRAKDYYIVLSGLEEKERVVTNGNFKIDSALQIQAKPSMMNPLGYYSKNEHLLTQDEMISIENVGILSETIKYYLEVAKDLAEDNPHKAAGHLELLKNDIDKIIANYSLDDKKGGIIKDILLLKSKVQKIDHNIESLRMQFKDISNIIKEILEKYKYEDDLKLYTVFCEMAFDSKGAYWFQDKANSIHNPYFGAKMLKCGEIKKEYGKK